MESFNIIAEELRSILQRNKEPAGNLEEGSDGTKSVFQSDWPGLE